MLHFPGEMMPGQFGPRRRTPGNSSTKRLKTIASSWAGMPSVMQTMNLMPPAAASMIASAANLGGTETNDAVAPVASTASFTVLKTGMPSTSVPPLPSLQIRPRARPVAPAWTSTRHTSQGPMPNVSSSV